MDEYTSDDDLAYFERRAEAELELAQKATRAEVVAAHVALANAYLDRIEQLRSRSAEPPDAAEQDSGVEDTCSGGTGHGRG